MILSMATERVTVSLESDLAAAIREAAEADHENVSAWIATAARRLLAARGLRQVVEEWERTQGAFTDDEIAEARRRLGW
jgi:hypothetical protein